MDIRLVLKNIGVIRLDVNRMYLCFHFSPDTPIRPDKLLKIMGRKRSRFRFLSDTKLKVSLSSHSDEEALSEAVEFIMIIEKIRNGDKS